MNLPSGLMRSPLSFSPVSRERQEDKAVALERAGRGLSSLGSIRSAGSSVILGGERDQCSLEFGVGLTLDSTAQTVENLHAKEIWVRSLR